MPSHTIHEKSGNALATERNIINRVEPAASGSGRQLNTLGQGTFKTLEKINPSGALQARKQANGAVSFYWRYSIGAKSERVLIGLYDPSASPKNLTATAKGFSLVAAVRAAEALALEHHNFEGGRPALLAAKLKADKAAHEHAQKIGSQTLASLLDHYTEHLEKLERRSHSDARSIFQLHVKQAWPKIAELPANEITGDQINEMMRRLAEDDKGRTANKLRSYIRAAYQTARAARSKVSIARHFRDYEIKNNPAFDTEPDESQNRAQKNPLLAEDLRKYWQHIKAAEDFKGAVLRLHLLTGGQRIEQLVKLRTDHIEKGHILLFDGKGRPGKPPREHRVPLVPAAAQALAKCKPSGRYAISTDGGETHLAATTLSQWAKGAAIGIAAFQAKRIRSGVETLLAASGVSRDIRGRLQSHGISGVQDRHYDGHDYMKEKREALELLHAHVSSGRRAR